MAGNPYMRIEGAKLDTTAGRDAQARADSMWADLGGIANQTVQNIQKNEESKTEANAKAKQRASERKLINQRIKESEVDSELKKQKLSEAEIESAMNNIIQSSVKRTERDGTTPDTITKKDIDNLSKEDQTKLDLLNKQRVKQFDFGTVKDGTRTYTNADGEQQTILDMSKYSDSTDDAKKKFRDASLKDRFYKSDAGKEYGAVESGSSSSLKSRSDERQKGANLLKDYYKSQNAKNRDTTKSDESSRKLEDAKLLTPEQKKAEEVAKKTEESRAFDKYRSKFDISKKTYTDMKDDLRKASDKKYAEAYNKIVTVTKPGVPKYKTKDVEKVTEGIKAHYQAMFKTGSSDPVSKDSVLGKAITRASISELNKFKEQRAKVDAVNAKAAKDKSSTLLDAQIAITKDKLKQTQKKEDSDSTKELENKLEKDLARYKI